MCFIYKFEKKILPERFEEKKNREKESKGGNVIVLISIRIEYLLKISMNDRRPFTNKHHFPKIIRIIVNKSKNGFFFVLLLADGVVKHNKIARTIYRDTIMNLW